VLPRSAKKDEKSKIGKMGDAIKGKEFRANENCHHHLQTSFFRSKPLAAITGKQQELKKLANELLGKAADFTSGNVSLNSRQLKPCEG